MKPTIYCAHTSVKKLSDLKPHPDNENEHPREQIEALAEIIKENGQRLAIVISKRSGYITKGHGRLQAITLLGWDEAAVDEQDYASDLEELRDRVADNEIARYAEFNFKKFKLNLKKLNLSVADMPLKKFGLLDLKTTDKAEKKDKPPEDKGTTSDGLQCPQCGFTWGLNEKA